MVELPAALVAPFIAWMGNSLLEHLASVQPDGDQEYAVIETHGLSDL